MRLLHVIDIFAPEKGGPPEAVRQLVNSCIVGGSQVEVAFLDDPHETFLNNIPCPVRAVLFTTKAERDLARLA